MASRPAFLAREPQRSPNRSPAVSPDRHRRIPGNRPRDPRVQPWRPSPQPPAPKGPLFPGTPKKPNVPFARPPHIPRSPLAPMRLAPLRAARAIVPRLLPGLGWALLAWDLYDLWRWWAQQGQQSNHTSSGGCGQDPTNGRPSAFGWREGSGCYSQIPHPFNEGPYDTIPPYSRFYPFLFYSAMLYGPPIYNEWKDIKWWYYPNGWNGVNPLEDPAPQITPLPPGMPEDNPYPYPFAPQPFPFTPPLVRPNPQPQPPPLIVPFPTGGPPSVPSIDITPGGQIAPGRHEIRPPEENEREKKKRMRPDTSFKIYKFLEKYGGSYMEIDDAVAAIYKGLPWKLRRWRGRDGVWRDRDHTSTRRLERLYSSLGQLDVEKAMIELVKDQLSDKAFGMVGRHLKNKTRELGDAGLWSGARGLGQGTPLSNHDEEARKKLIRDKFKAQSDDSRWYRVREQQSDGSWRSVLKQRPNTQIPWYRQQSYYDRRAGRGTAAFWELTNQERASNAKTVPGYYYAPGRSPRPLIKRV